MRSGQGIGLAQKIRELLSTGPATNDELVDSIPEFSRKQVESSIHELIRGKQITKKYWYGPYHLTPKGYKFLRNPPRLINYKPPIDFADKPVNKSKTFIIEPDDKSLCKGRTSPLPEPLPEPDIPKIGDPYLPPLGSYSPDIQNIVELAHGSIILMIDIVNENTSMKIELQEMKNSNKHLISKNWELIQENEKIKNKIDTLFAIYTKESNQ